jgi:two-component SAPR family response regulator
MSGREKSSALAQIVTHLSIDNFEEMVTGKKLVILYPTVSYRNVFLSYFLQVSNDNVIYYRLPHNDMPLQMWLQDMKKFIPEADTPFYKTKFKAGDSHSPKELAEMLAQYLKAVTRNFTVVYLDEIDRTPQNDQFREFMQTLVDQLPDKLQLVINARKLTYLPWITYINEEICTVLGTNMRKDNLMYTPAKDYKPQLEVKALGQGTAYVNGHEIVSWDGALPRMMFYYFMDNHLVTRDQIFQVFWPNLPVKEATNVFHVTKRKIGEQISRLVADGNDYELTVYSTGFYMPNPGVERHYDVAEFEQAINAAYTEEDEERMTRLYETAINLYKGDFLMSMEMPWVQKRRERLRVMFVDALIGMGRIHYRHDRHETAISYFIRSLREVPMREDVHRDVMRLYVKLGRRSEAVEQYYKLEKLLDTTLKVAPARETRELFDEILKA